MTKQQKNFITTTNYTQKINDKIIKYLFLGHRIYAQRWSNNQLQDAHN